MYLASHQRGQCFCSDQCGAGERGRLSDTQPQSMEIKGKTTAGFQLGFQLDSNGEFPLSQRTVRRGTEPNAVGVMFLISMRKLNLLLEKIRCVSLILRLR